MIEFLDYDEYDTLYVTIALSRYIHCQAKYWFAYIDEDGSLICICKILNIDEYLNLRVVLDLFCDFKTRHNDYHKVKVYVCCNDTEVKNLIKRDYKILYKQ